MSNGISDCYTPAPVCIDRVLFGTYEQNECGPIIKDGCVSGTFTVDRYPVVIKGFDIEPGVKIVLEHGVGRNGIEFFEAVKAGCGGLTGLTSCDNFLVIPIPGVYRLNRCYCDPLADPVGLPHVEWKEVTTGLMTSLGDMKTMGCCNDAVTTLLNDGPGACKTLVIGTNTVVICPDTAVSVVQTPVSTLLTVGANTYTIPHGDEVACVAGGITINGVLCPSGSAVGFVDNGDCTGTLTIDGVPHTVLTEFKPNHDPAAITNPDGAITVISAGQSFSLTFNEENAAAQLVGNPVSRGILCSALTACIDARIPVVPAATDTVQGKVALAVAANYPQATNDTDAVTPAYLAASLNNLLIVSADSGNLISNGIDGAAYLNSCDIFDGATADPRPNVNSGMRVVGVNTAGLGCDDVKFEVAQFSDIEGAGVAGQELGKSKLLTVDAIANILRVDTTNNVYGDGFFAAARSTGAAVSGLGYAAALDNTGTAVTAGGYSAGQQNTGSNVTAMGHGAGQRNTGSVASFTGHVAGQDNTGQAVSGAGYGALQLNTGSFVSGMGHSAAQLNTGTQVSASGYSPAYYNQGNEVSADGYNAGYYNTGNRVSVSGGNAGKNNTGSNVSVHGENALLFNDKNNVSAYGFNAGNGAFTIIQAGVTVTQTSPTSVTIAPATAAAVGSVVQLISNTAGVTNLSGHTRSFTVTSPTALQLIVGVGGVGAGGLQAGITTATLIQVQNWDNNSYFGNSAIGTGPNQAVLGGPSQTPCGWAAFTVISDERQKLLVDSDLKQRGMAVLENIQPTLYRMNPDARYSGIETVLETHYFDESGTRVDASDSRGKAAKDKGITSKEVSVQQPFMTKNDGSRADERLTFGFIAQNVMKAGEAAGLKPNEVGIRDLAAEGGSDMLLLDTTALIADLVLAVKQLNERVKVLGG